MTKKERQRIRSDRFPDMHPHIFDKLVKMVPYVILEPVKFVSRRKWKQ